MASSPLESAIERLIESLRSATSGSSASPFKSRITGQVDPQYSSVGIFTSLLGGLSPKLRLFSSEIARAADNMRQARQTSGISLGTNPASYKKLLGSNFLSSHEKEVLSKSIDSAKKSRDYYRSVVKASAKLRQQKNLLYQKYLSGPTPASWNAYSAAASRYSSHKIYVRQRAKREADRIAANAVTAGRTAAGVVGNRATMAAAAGAVTVPIAALTALAASAYVAAKATRSYAEHTNEQNSKLAFYNPKTARSAVELSMGQMRRNFAMADYLSNSSSTLSRSVDKMRDSWFGFDASVNEMKNILGISATNASSKLAPFFGQQAANMSKWLQDLGFGKPGNNDPGKLTEFSNNFIEKFTNIALGAWNIPANALNQLGQGNPNMPKIPVIPWFGGANPPNAKDVLAGSAEGFALGLGQKHLMPFLAGPVRAMPLPDKNPGFGNLRKKL